MKNYFSSILSSSLGNILEWYDFGLFTIFAGLFSALFFPMQDPAASFIAIIAVFSIGLFCRPLGALLFGYLGDKYGRAMTLRLSILMIALPTFLLSFIPTYQQIGIYAPLCLTFIRMWQGISIGGEYSGNLVYLVEAAPVNYRASFSTFATMGANFGILLASVVGFIFNHLFAAYLSLGAWRIPYFVSGLFCLAIYFFRLRIKETEVFEYLKVHHLLAKNPIKTLFRKNFSDILRTIGLVCMGSTFYFFCFVYFPLFLQDTSRYSAATISFFMTLMICFMIIIIPIAGFLCDKIGRRKLLLFNASFITLILIPGFYFLHFSPFVFSVLLLFTLASSFEQGTTPVAIIENFPAHARYTGVSLGYNLGNGLLGGSVPFICSWLQFHSHTSLAPAIYVAICAAITGLVVWFFVPETMGNNLQ